jgi:hypothetical protein
VRLVKIKNIPLLLLLSVSTSFAQTNELNKHIKSIRQAYHPKRNYSNQQLPDSTFIDYAIHRVINNEEHLKHITNRNLLTPLTLTRCFSSYAEIEGINSQNDTIEFEIRLSPFDSSLSKIEYDTLNHSIKSIDNQYPFGGTYVMPDLQISEIKISINKQPLTIPDTTYKNLFFPSLCEFGGFTKSISLYPSEDGNYLYLYIYGGNAAGTYFAKLIFDKKTIVAKWVVDYYPLSIYGCFSERFLGY